MKKVAILVFNNFLHDGRVLREAISLQKGGYDVRVIALHEDDLPEFEKVKNIPVYRIKLATRSWSKNPIIQVIKWLELFYRIVKNHRDADFYHVCDVLPLPVAMLIKKYFNKNAKVVYDAHELEFDRDMDRSIIGKIHVWLEQRYIHQVDQMITVSPPIVEAYQEKYGIPPPHLVMNCPNYNNIIPKDIFRKKFNLRKDQVIILYQGLLKTGRGMEELVEAFRKMKDDKFVLVFLGFGVLVDQIKKWEKELPNVFFFPGVHPNDLPEHTASADIGAYLVQNTNRSYDYALGNKLFEYIMAGLPVISSNLTASKKIITEGMGIIIEKDEPDFIKNAIEEIVENGFDFYKPHLAEAAKKYNWEEQEKVLLAVYQSLHEA